MIVDIYRGRLLRILSIQYIHVFLTEFEVLIAGYGPSFFPFDLFLKRKARGQEIEGGEKRGVVTYTTDREDEVSNIFIISLLCV